MLEFYTVLFVWIFDKVDDISDILENVTDVMLEFYTVLFVWIFDKTDEISDILENVILVMLKFIQYYLFEYLIKQMTYLIF